MVCVLALVLITWIYYIHATVALSCHDKNRNVHDGTMSAEEKEDDTSEFDALCENLNTVNTFTVNTTDCDEEEENFDPANLRLLFALMLMIAYGAFVRTVLRMSSLNIPYTVVLMLSGLVIGFLSNREELCEQMHTFTAIARIPPRIILFTFLPVLVFESAFSITPHTFMRSAVQIVVIAFVGMIVSTFMTAAVVQRLFPTYDWDFLTASLFGSIISATDPVAVVAILRDVGASDTLSVIIEGESLLNDGFAFLLYEILESIITCKVTLDDAPLFALKKFCQITLGGPVFGFVVGMICTTALSLIFNDSTVEITITLVAAYLTYYVGEDILGVSGVSAVVVLGIVMGSARTSISPEVEAFVHHFWAMLSYLANTVLFIIVGIVITETAFLTITVEDYIHLFLLYIALNVVRFLMLLIMYPWVSRIGYGLTWQNMIVMMWGGLRGAVGICLALDIYDNHVLCQESTIGPKFLFLTAGIVFLTLVINGTTTKKLLKLLKLSEISAGRIQDMGNAVRQLHLAQYRTIGLLKHDRLYYAADWRRVEKFTLIENPYLKSEKETKKKEGERRRRSLSLISASAYLFDHHTECPECFAVVENAPTLEEYKEMTDEARIRVLKALKLSYWRQFEHGILYHHAVSELVNIATAAEDKQMRLVEARDFNKFWRIEGCLPWFRDRSVKAFGLETEIFPRRPRNVIRRGCWWLATRTWFDAVFIMVILLHMCQAIWEITYWFQYPDENWKYENFFFGCSIFFNCIYIIEASIKIIGRGPKDYFCMHKLNWIDVVVIMFGVPENALYFAHLNDDDKSLLIFLKLFRISRVARLVKALILVPRFMPLLESMINKRLYLGYAIGAGFVKSVDDVLKFLPQMVDNPKVLRRLKQALLQERMEVIREMGILQRDHPGVAIALKTRRASRSVLNEMRENLMELKADGLVDEMECDLIIARLEERMKKLWASPPSIPPSPSERLLENVSWIGRRKEIYEYFKENAQLVSFASSELICRADHRLNGIYIIVSGMVKIKYVPTEEILDNFVKEGEIPYMELFLDLTFKTKQEDFLMTGSVLGEIGVLTNHRRAATVKCETNVDAYFISTGVIKSARNIFSEDDVSLESTIWRAVGIRLAMAVFPKHVNYSTWSTDKIQLHIERSCVPVGDEFDVITVFDFISEILIIQGKVKDSFSDQVFYAPDLIPKGVSEIILSHSSRFKTRVLIISFEDVDEKDAVEGKNPQFFTLLKLIDDSSPLEKHRRSRPKFHSSTLGSISLQSSQFAQNFVEKARHTSSAIRKMKVRHTPKIPHKKKRSDKSKTRPRSQSTSTMRTQTQRN